LELLLLVTGILNFSNYTITSTIYRLHELGVRKIHGATTSNLLLKQILNVTAVLVTASVLIVGAAYLIRSFEWMPVIKFLLAVLVITICIIALALWIFLSRTNYVAAIKSSSGSNKTRSAMMSSLIVFQFFVTTTMVSSVIIVDRQIRFLSEGNPGFLTDALVIIEGVQGHGEALKDQLLQSGAVESASFTTSSPGDIYPFSASALRNSGTRIINDFAFVDYDYFDLMKIPVVDGRVFSREFGADTYQNSIVINKTAQRLLGSKGVGDEITPNPKSDRPMYFKVIGVVGDFHSASFHQEIRPMLFLFSPVGSKLAVRLSQNANRSSIEKINNIWKSLYKDLPLDSYFVEDRIRNFYKRESAFNETFWGLGLGCLAIACSGLIIVSFLALRERRKEMCIRKIIGAAGSTIYFLSLEKMMKMIAIAIVISAPATYYLMEYWLSNFAYHIGLSALDFIKGGLFILLAAVAFASPFGLRLANGMPLTELRKE
jgi:putative ABC transport system permease protein